MANPKRSLEQELVVDGVKLTWCLHREQQWCTADGWKGLSIRVRPADEDHRELLLEYPVIKEQKAGWARAKLPVRPRIRPSKVEAHIRLAMAAGWDPQGRGKAFAFQMQELPG